jgi:hypothetical protein
VIAAFQGWKNRLLDLAVDNPLETLLTLVLGSAWVFYLAEERENEGINTYDDAVYYISTCLSVGYANVFPKTQVGKFVAAVVMIIGPSLSSWVVEGRLIGRQPQPASREPDGRIWSEQVGMFFGFDPSGLLRVYLPDGTMLLTHAEERKRAEEAEQRLAEAMAELERLRGSSPDQ